MKQDKSYIVIWGSGSESIAFITSLTIQNETKFIVNINPFKEGMYMSMIIQKIISPDCL